MGQWVDGPMDLMVNRPKGLGFGGNNGGWAESFNSTMAGRVNG